MPPPRVFSLRNVKEFEALFFDGEEPRSLPDTDHGMYVTIPLSEDLLRSPSYYADTFMNTLSRVLSFGVCPRYMSLKLLATPEFLHTARTKKMSLDMTPLTISPLSSPQKYPQNFTLDLTNTALNTKSVMAFAKFIANRHYPANFSLILSNNHLDMVGLTALAQALSAGQESGAYGLRLVLRNTLNRDRITQMSVAKSFADVLSSARFPRGLFLDLNLGWDSTFPELRAPELMQVALDTQCSSDLARLMVDGVVTGDAVADRRIRQRIEESVKFAPIFEKLAREQAESRIMPQTQDDDMFKSFYETSTQFPSISASPQSPKLTPMMHMAKQLLANQRRYDEGTLRMDFARRQSSMKKIHEILAGYISAEYAIGYDEILSKKGRRLEMATWEDLGSVVEPVVWKAPTSASALQSIPQEEPVIAEKSRWSLASIPGIPSMPSFATSSIPTVPRMSEITGALSRMSRYRPWE